MDVTILAVTVKIGDCEFKAYPLDSRDKGADGRYMVVISEGKEPVELIKEGEAWFVQVADGVEIQFHLTSRPAV